MLEDSDRVEASLTARHATGTGRGGQRTRGHAEALQGERAAADDELRPDTAAAGAGEGELPAAADRQRRGRRDDAAAHGIVKEYKADDKVVTGILFIDKESQEIHETMNTTATPLRELDEAKLCPGSTALEEINTLHR